MPKRTDIHKILIIGSGPIVIGQACEFDYSGTQACKALRQEGYEIVLVNSNPATIMTDPETADITYIEPLTVASVTEIIRRERPDALLPTVGGQTALNLAIALEDAGVLQEYNVEMIGENATRSKLPRIVTCSNRRWTKPVSRCLAVVSRSRGTKRKRSSSRQDIRRLSGRHSRSAELAAG